MLLATSAPLAAPHAAATSRAQVASKTKTNNESDCAQALTTAQTRRLVGHTWARQVQSCRTIFVANWRKTHYSVCTNQNSRSLDMTIFEAGLICIILMISWSSQTQVVLGSRPRVQLCEDTCANRSVCAHTFLFTRALSHKCHRSSFLLLQHITRTRYDIVQFVLKISEKNWYKLVNIPFYRRVSWCRASTNVPWCSSPPQQCLRASHTRAAWRTALCSESGSPSNRSRSEALKSIQSQNVENSITCLATLKSKFLMSADRLFRNEAKHDPTFYRSQCYTSQTTYIRKINITDDVSTRGCVPSALS